MLKCDGREQLQCVTLVDRDGGQEVVDAAYLFVFIGAAPLTDWLPPTLVRDRSGFVVTGPELVAGGRRPDGWDLDRDPYLLESSSPGSSWPATYAPSRSSGSPRRSARARWRSRSSTATWPSRGA